jgi:hypothetical protein
MSGSLEVMLVYVSPFSFCAFYCFREGGGLLPSLLPRGRRGDPLPYHLPAGVMVMTLLRCIDVLVLPASLSVLRSLPEGVVSNIKQQLSPLDWDCYRAACLLPLHLNVGRKECLNVHVREGTRQERALLSDPQAQKLFVTLYAKRANNTALQKLQSMPNLKDLRLDECGLQAAICCAFVALTRFTNARWMLQAVQQFPR